ncbi:MAG: GGDEF domain-containing protein [Spirochaetia bacterium]|nr:GGDEF domain-containing protein [Spirochaetia bacterium]
MNITSQTLLEQLRITERDIKRRQELLTLSEKDTKNLVYIKTEIAKNIDNIVNEFYQTQIKSEEIDRLIGDAESLLRLKKHMRKYILALFDGLYSSDYVHSRLRIGLVHKRIGVTPKLYISAVRNLQDLLNKYIKPLAAHDCVKCGQLTGSLNKIILFDLELVFDTYIHGLMEEVQRSKDELEEYASSLEEIVEKRTQDLERLARIDSLTGLFNQRSFFEELIRELSRCQRNDESLTLAYIDLDGFKKANDSYGHKFGDKILMLLGKSITESVRPADTGARYGGDEFCVIFPETTVHEAEVVCKRIIKKFNQLNEKKEVALSIGLAESNIKSVYDSDTLIKKADEAMYKSKKKVGHFITKAK